MSPVVGFGAWADAGVTSEAPTFENTELLPITESFQVVADHFVGFRGFFHLPIQRVREFGHLGFEGDAVVLDGSSSDVAAWRSAALAFSILE